MVERLVSEFCGGVRTLALAYRGIDRWTRAFEPIRFEPSNDSSPLLTPHGVYLITGGLGEIGSAFAEHLFDRVGARPVLVGRSRLPAREEWDEWLAQHGSDDPMSQRIRRLQTLEHRGAEVLVLSGDVASERDMTEIARYATRHFGQIAGIIHAAGHVGMETLIPLTETGQQQCDWHWRPKVDAVAILEKLVESHSIPLVVLISSIAAVLGGLGFAAYAPANAFLDATAQRRRRTSQTRWTSIGWDITDTREEALGLISRLFSHDLPPHVVISAVDLQTRIDTWLNPESLHRETAREAGHATIVARAMSARRTSTPYVAPATQAEEQVAMLWQEVLGIEEIGVNDNFFDLGGHSLMATQLVSRLRRDANINVPLRAFFEAQTIKQLALVIEEAIIAELEQIPDDELIASEV